MNPTSSVPDTAVDPVCGKTFDPHKVRFTAKEDDTTLYFCSDECRRQYGTADAETKKGFWKRYTDRLKNTHCTQTPPECR